MRSHRKVAAGVALAASLGFASCLLPTIAAEAASDAEASQAYYESAREQLEQGRGNAAIIELRNALQLDPQNFDARLLLGKLRLLDGDADAAEKDLRIALEGKFSDEAEVLLGRALIEQLKFQDVIRMVSRDALTEEHQQAKLLVIADAYWGLGDLDQVESLYSQVLETWPDNRNAKLGTVRLFVARQQRGTAERLTDALIAEFPEFSDAWVMRADLAILDQNAERAFEALDRALSLDPANINALIHRARLFLDMGNLDRTHEDLRSIERLQSRNPFALYLRTAWLFARNELLQADGLYSAIEPLLPEEPPALLLGALVKLSLSEYAQAERFLLRYLSHRPDSVAARRTLGLVLIRLRNPVSAMGVLEPLVEEHPNDSAALHLLASAYLQLGRHGLASRMLQQILEQGRTDAEELARAGLIELAAGAGLGNWTPSADKRVLPEGLAEELFPIVDLLQARDLEAARDRVRVLKRQYPDNPFLLTLEGIVLYQRGNSDASRASFERALSIEPEFLIALDNLDRLDQIEGQESSIEPRMRQLLLRRPRSDGLILRLADYLARRKGAQVAIGFLEERRLNYMESIPLSERLIEAHLSIGTPARTVELLTELLITHADRAPVLAYIRRIFDDLGETERSLEVSRRLIVLEPYVVEHRLNFAKSLVEAGDMEAAEEALLAAREIDPGSIDATRSLIGIALDRGDEAAAFRIADEIRPFDEILSDRLSAHIQIKLGKHAEAIEILERTYAKNPQPDLAIDNFFAHRAAGDLDGAVTVLAAHLETLPGDRQARHALASTLAEMERFERAMAEYKALVESDESDVLALNNYAWLRDKLGFDDGLEFAARAYQIAPGTSEVADTYGWLLVQKNESEQAVPVLRRAVGQAPRDPNIRFRLAFALNEVGKASEAVRILRGILESESPFTERTNAESLLRSLDGSLEP